jgi:drug/metabolite transporter (DMT)-like permease
MTRLRADLLLLLCSMIWGTAFVAQKAGNGAAGPLAFVGGRFMLSALMLAPLAWWEWRRTAGAIRWRDWRLAGVTGLCLFSGSALQQIGVGTTSVTNAGFITALYIAFVPFAAWIVFKRPVTRLVLAACAISLTGAWLLAGHGQAAHLALGDLLVLGSAILYALHIIAVSLFLKASPRPFFLCLVQNTVSAVAGWTLAGAFEPVRLAGLEAALPTIAYTGILSGGVAYTLQIVGQRHTPATEAALIMSMESVFAALAAAIILGERLSLLGGLGCAMILAGVIMVEVLPAVLRGQAAGAVPPLGEVPLD